MRKPINKVAFAASMLLLGAVVSYLFFLVHSEKKTLVDSPAVANTQNPIGKFNGPPCRDEK
ncbi:MAG: hypothetical protein JKY98_04360, partial [Gammaproteobacteria bacterium]|nr:hypothetical protein [Gammaproteobacteria bacterium]